MAILKFQPKNQPAQLRCTGCSITIDAPCDCGKPFAYIPAGKAAVAAVAAHPGESSRMISEKTNIPQRTISRAQRLLTEPNGSVDRRTGRDGKVRQMPKKVKVTNAMKIEIENFLAWAQGLLRSDTPDNIMEGLEELTAKYGAVETEGARKKIKQDFRTMSSRLLKLAQ